MEKPRHPVLSQSLSRTLKKLYKRMWWQSKKPDQQPLVLPYWPLSLWRSTVKLDPKLSSVLMAFPTLALDLLMVSKMISKRWRKSKSFILRLDRLPRTKVSQSTSFPLKEKSVTSTLSPVSVKLQAVRSRESNRKTWSTTSATFSLFLPLLPTLKPRSNSTKVLSLGTKKKKIFLTASRSWSRISAASMKKPNSHLSTRWRKSEIS